MAHSRRRRKKNNGGGLLNIISSAALLVIAVFLVIFVVLYIKNGSSLGNLFGNGGEETASESSETETDESEESIADLGSDEYGLVTLNDGSIVYVLDKNEAAEYDEDQLIDVSALREDGSSANAAAAEERYYLKDSWLDINGNLYRFDSEGHACTDKYSERAFNYEFDEDGILLSIKYNSSYSGSSESTEADYPGLVRTKALWAFMDENKTVGRYKALMYKKTTESLSYALGSESSMQYASPYAFEIVGSSIYYLAVPEGSADISASGSGSTESSGDTSGSEASSADLVLKNIAGKVFCMTPGADKRYIAAENAYGFKAIKDGSGKTVVYYYDGSHIRRSTSTKEDETLLVFSEDASYKVDISEGDKAYLELSTGERVTLQSSNFKAGNFRYALAGDGEILKVAEKTTVSKGGYTYAVETGEAFGRTASRVTRKSTDGITEVISGEFDGTTANLHYDYDTGSMVAEYTDNSGVSGLLRISIDGDVDLIEDARTSSSRVTLYGLQDSKAIYKYTEGGENKFSSARIDASTPIAAGVDPVALSSDDPSEQTAETPAGEDYDSAGTNGAAIPGAAPGETSADSSSDSGTSVVTGPGVNTTDIVNGPGGG